MPARRRRRPRVCTGGLLRPTRSCTSWPTPPPGTPPISAPATTATPPATSWPCLERLIGCIASRGPNGEGASERVGRWDASDRTRLRHRTGGRPLAGGRGGGRSGAPSRGSDATAS
eukprot:scaffold1515_cov119-Isochrysis_galbana.AAC.2